MNKSGDSRHTGECPLVIAGVKVNTKEGSSICLKCDDDLHACPFEHDVITEIWVSCPNCKIFDTIWLVNGKVESNRYWNQDKFGNISHKKCQSERFAQVFYTT